MLQNLLSKNNLIAGAIGIVLLLVAAYLLFFHAPASGTVAVTGSAPTSPAESTFVGLAAQLEPLGFDTSILGDARFMALVDIHTAVVPETAGRHDPFAPLGR